MVWLSNSLVRMLLVTSSLLQGLSLWSTFRWNLPSWSRNYWKKSTSVNSCRRRQKRLAEVFLPFWFLHLLTCKVTHETVVLFCFFPLCNFKPIFNNKSANLQILLSIAINFAAAAKGVWCQPSTISANHWRDKAKEENKKGHQGTFLTDELIASFNLTRQILLR